ncbi:MAG: transferase [Desulfobacterales bacterium]|nr:transferase [Desulfobacterales bacterium]
MKALQTLFDRIVQRVNINLRETGYDVKPFVKDLIPFDRLIKFYAFYGVTPHHLLDLQFRQSNLAGSYFLGKCHTTNSILYKSDIRGDELKKKGDIYHYKDFQIPLSEDEGIRIEDSFLVKTLIHCFSHDPETLEDFFITNTVATHYANIHGSPIDGSFLGPFVTVDLTTTNDCIIGAYSYVQAGEIDHLNLEPGTVWVRSPELFDFRYRHSQEQLRRYIHFESGQAPQGLLIDFMRERKEDFQHIYNTVNLEPYDAPETASLDRYAVVKSQTKICDNVLVAERAYLENAYLGKGANAQEHCYIINSRLEGYNVTAHGGKIIEADIEPNVLVGFNSFLRGRPNSRLNIGKESIIMPHTIIDIDQPLTIPAGHLVWGHIDGQDDLASNSVALDQLAKVKDSLNIGDMQFEGDGGAFVTAFRDRVHHILEANGAFFDGVEKKGHAQKNQNISFNTIQPYPDGELAGLYPTIIIRP